MVLIFVQIGEIDKYIQFSHLPELIISPSDNFRFFVYDWKKIVNNRKSHITLVVNLIYSGNCFTNMSEAID